MIRGEALGLGPRGVIRDEALRLGPGGVIRGEALRARAPRCDKR